MSKLWIATAISPYYNEYGSITVVAETREDAIAKADAMLRAELSDATYVPVQRYIENLHENLGGTIREIPEGVIIDFGAVQR